MPPKRRHLAVFLASGRREDFPEANAWALVGPNERDLELFERDWEAHQTRRTIAYFPAGGWHGLTLGELVAENPEAKRLGFRVPVQS